MLYTQASEVSRADFCPRKPLRVVLAVALLANGKGDVAVLDHVLNLLSHRQNKEDQPVHDQNGPEDGHVEDLEEGAEEGDGDCARGPVPEFELGEAADEGLELLVLLGRESADGAVLHLIVEGVVGRIELGLKEGEEEVEQVDAQSVRDDIPSLSKKDAQEEEEQGDAGADPSVQHKGRRLVQEGLVMSLDLGRVRRDAREGGLIGLRRVHLVEVPAGRGREVLG